MHATAKDSGLSVRKHFPNAICVQHEYFKFPDFQNLKTAGQKKGKIKYFK